SLFRAEDISLIQLYIPLEIAQPTVAELGELGQVEFLDLNPNVNAFQRAFVGEIRRLDEMERKLRFLENQIEKTGIKPKPLTGNLYYGRTRTQQEIDDLEARLTEHEARIQQMNESQDTLQKRYLELSELRQVLRETAVFFEQAESRTDDPLLVIQREDSHLLAGNPSPDPEDAQDQRDSGRINLGFVAGVVPRARMGIFERILFRALRGNLYMNFAEIDEPVTDPGTDEVVQKNVFIIFAHGREILQKIRKICESMGATLYPVDSHPEKRREDALAVISRIEDLKHVLDSTRNTRRMELSKVAESIEAWAMMVKKEKAIYHIMNMFNYDQNRKALIAEGWCPTNSINSITYALRGVTERTGSTIPPILNELRTKKTKPTFHRTNKFTAGFQAIVDAYGVATYQEVNPGLFTIISFPFLFALMFGDVGHGLLVTGALVYILWKEKELNVKNGGEVIFDGSKPPNLISTIRWDMFFGGRYMIFLMALFSVFTGLIYNDLFSKPLNWFGTGYKFHTEHDHEMRVGEKLWTYAVGIDPAWQLAENKLLFLNSYKMKMGIIFGVMQMIFGLTIQIFNHIHFKQVQYIYAETIPQILFTVSIFGYLVFMILYKWSVDWLAVGLNPPSLLNTLIYMFLAPGSVAPSEVLFPGQAALQVFLVLLALLCIPWMLCAKPYLIWKESVRHRLQGYDNVQGNRDSLDSDRTGEVTPHNGDGGHGGEGGGGEGHGEHEEFSEVVIHQVIHTIEFVLSSISHTASYLRLWALSLAHAQLSEVLWDMVLANAFTMKGVGGTIALYIAFGAWFYLTVCILIGMEGLSAFLHALRLHWVEFNSKFYGGGGRAFIPFAFADFVEANGGPAE
ncbi:V-type ATPase, V0 complex, 116kDa subunit family, partial [Cladochytrium replicatum]